MSEHINHNDLLSSGGHRWIWGTRQQTEKILRAPGVSGAARIVINNGPLPGIIAGMAGGPACLLANDGSASASHQTMDAVESALIALVNSGAAVEWEDDQGHTGTQLVLTQYEPLGERHVDVNSGAVMQFYRLHVLDLTGEFA